MVLHTSTVTMSWRFHSDQSPAYTGKQQTPQVPLLGKGLSGCFTALWFCTGFLPTLFCIFPLSVTVFGRDYDPKGCQSVFQLPVKKEIYLPWMRGLPHGNREHIHEGLIQWTPQLSVAPTLYWFTHLHLCISCQPEHSGEGTFPTFPSCSSLMIPGSTGWISTFYRRKLKLS